MKSGIISIISYVLCGIFRSELHILFIIFFIAVLSFVYIFFAEYEFLYVM